MQLNQQKQRLKKLLDQKKSSKQLGYTQKESSRRGSLFYCEIFLKALIAQKFLPLCTFHTHMHLLTAGAHHLYFDRHGHSPTTRQRKKPDFLAKVSTSKTRSLTWILFFNCFYISARILTWRVSWPLKPQKYLQYSNVTSWLQYFLCLFVKMSKIYLESLKTNIWNTNSLKN